jgi:hypothetical protein
MNILYLAFISITILAITIVVLLKLYGYYNTTKIAISNEKECLNAKRQQFIDNWTKYFWANPKRFIWITIFYIFLILLGVAVGGFLGIFFSVFTTISYIPFLVFARKSYLWFPKYAQEKLESFERDIIDAIKEEITLEGDNIQKFSDGDSEFDTEPKIFKFPVNVKKFDYPMFDFGSDTPSVTSERKLEFLILSREYFSICKEATTFNLLYPERGSSSQKCPEVKGSGECNEYYYSQMQNVEYDGKAIHIIYNTGTPDVSFPCKKGSQKEAMKALKEKLRLTERQRLKKIQEHKYYEDIKDKREKTKED